MSVEGYLSQMRLQESMVQESPRTSRWKGAVKVALHFWNSLPGGAYPGSHPTRAQFLHEVTTSLVEYGHALIWQSPGKYGCKAVWSLPVLHTMAVLDKAGGSVVYRTKHPTTGKVTTIPSSEVTSLVF